MSPDSHSVSFNESKLRQEIIDSLLSQGFEIEKDIKPSENGKKALKNLHQKKRLESLEKHREFLKSKIKKVKKYSISGEDLDPSAIELKLKEVLPDSVESEIFLFWNLMWWSLPYERPIGRQMRFILWDTYHNAPFGLIGLQSPPISSSIRDSYLGLENGNKEYWINQSLYGQRIGALPPYNEILGGKMVSLALTSNEVREAYSKKYSDKITWMEQKILPSRLLFISTTSAYGKSSVYERIKYKGDLVGEFIGFTSGAGTFQLTDELYQKCLAFLEFKGYNIKRGYGTGPSRKLKLASRAFRLLKIRNYQYHNIQRGYYVFSFVDNLHEVIHSTKEPNFYNRPFMDLTEFWKERWAQPRSTRTQSWKNCDINQAFLNFEKEIGI